MNFRRPAALAALTLAGLAIGTGIASAHVRVTADTTTPGAYAVLTFKVPTESATASTTGVTITLPTATPLESVSFQQVPGWTAKAVTTTLPTPIKVDDDTITEAVTSVSWTAQDGDGIPSGGFGTFALSVGPLPQTTSLAFPVDQRYSDGTVVKWADAQAAGAAEPEHPVPTLTLGAAATGGGSGATVTATGTDAAAVVAANTDTTARVTAIAALVIAAFSVLMGAIALRRPAAVAAATALAAESAAPQPESPPKTRPAAASATPRQKRNR